MDAVELQQDIEFYCPNCACVLEPQYETYSNQIRYECDICDFEHWEYLEEY